MESRMIKIDGRKLDKIITERGLTRTAMSEKMGFNQGFISNVVSRGMINPYAAKMLEMLFDIKLEEIKVKEPEPEQPECIKPQEGVLEAPQIDYQKLYAVIYKAVVEAIKKAGTEE